MTFFVLASRLNFLIETEDSEVVYFKNFKVHKINVVQYQYEPISHRCIYIYKHLTSVFIKRLTDGSIYSFYLCSLQKQSFQTMHSVKRSLWTQVNGRMQQYSYLGIFFAACVFASTDIASWLWVLLLFSLKTNEVLFK